MYHYVLSVKQLAATVAVVMLLMPWPVLAASPSGTFVTTADAFITDSGGGSWMLANSPGNGLVIEKNGMQTVSANVILLTYIHGRVYQENKSLGWWYWNGRGWEDTTNPLTSSSSGTSIPSASYIVDGNKDVWTVSNGIILKNGLMAGYSANVIELYYLNGTVYQENNALGWWYWNGSTWINSSNPVGQGAVATVGTGGSSPAGISVDLGAPGATVPGSLWGVSTGALISNGFAGFAGGTDPAFQASAKLLNFQSMRFNASSGTHGVFWEDAIFANGINNPNWSYLDGWFSIASSFWNKNNMLIVGVGPAHGNVQRNPSEWASIAVQMAAHFKAKGMEVFYWEVGNEPDGVVDINTYIADFNAIAQALHNFNPAYKVGGPVTSWDNGSYITPWAKQCGDYADFTDWHSYPVNPNDDDATMYQKGIRGEVNNIPSELAGTAMKSKPYALLEYNINGTYGVDPRQVTYKNAVYTALRLTESFKQNPLFQIGGIWDIMKDSNYGVIGPNGNANSTIVPVGYYLGEAGQVMPGVQVSATVNVSGNLKAFATVNGHHFAIQLVNYDTNATYTIGVTAKLPGGGNFGGMYNVWQIGSSNPAVPQAGEMAYNTPLSIPPATVVILTGVEQ